MTKYIYKWDELTNRNLVLKPASFHHIAFQYILQIDGALFTANLGEIYINTLKSPNVYLISNK